MRTMALVLLTVVLAMFGVTQAQASHGVSGAGGGQTTGQQFAFSASSASDGTRPRGHIHVMDALGRVEATVTGVRYGSTSLGNTIILCGQVMNGPAGWDGIIAAAAVDPQGRKGFIAQLEVSVPSCVGGEPVEWLDLPEVTQGSIHIHLP